MRLTDMRLAAVAALLTLAPLVAVAQPATKIPRVGFLATGGLVFTSTHGRDAFVQGLRDLGYVEGRNVVVEYRDAEGKIDRLPEAALELVARKVDVIVTAGPVQTHAALQAIKTIPIVFAAAGDPVGSGLVESLARPGGNVTGLSTLTPELVGKRLELLKQAVPRASRVAVLRRPDALIGERVTKDMLAAADVAAPRAGVAASPPRGARPRRFRPGLRRHEPGGVDALTVLPTLTFLLQRGRLAQLAAQNRLPAVYPNRDFVDAGGLMAYGAHDADLFRRAATYVDKILKGAKPGDLPVEQATKFELAVNLKTARALGLTMPRSLVERADHVVE